MALRCRSSVLVALVPLVALSIVAEGRGAAQSLATNERAESRDHSPADVSTLLEAVRAEHELPALVAIVADDASVLAEGVTGLRDLSSDEPATLDDLWHIGSITKSFTSTLLATLVESGDLHWEDELADLIEEAAGTPFGSVPLTALGRHTSGMVANPEGPWFREIRNSTDPMIEQRRQTVAALLETEPTEGGRGQFLYSNAGYITLGHAFERVTEQPWEELLRERVLAPLELTSAGFGPPGRADLVDQPRGHNREESGEWTPVPPSAGADNPAALGPAGTLHMTIRDLVRYGQHHLRGERGESNLLSSESYHLLHGNGEQGYAMGWIVREEPWADGRRVIWHNGSNTLWYAYLALVPEANRVFAVVSNGSIQARAAVHAAAERLAADWLVQH